MSPPQPDLASQPPPFSLLTTLRYDTVLAESVQNLALSSTAPCPPSPSHSNNGRSKHNSSSLYMLRYHRDRLRSAATFFGWTEVAAGLEDLAGFESGVLRHVTRMGGVEAARVRVTISCDGEFGVNATALESVGLETLFPGDLDGVVDVGDGDGDWGGGKEGEGRRRVWEVCLAEVCTVPSAFTRYKTTERSVYGAAMSVGSASRRRLETLALPIPAAHFQPPPLLPSQPRPQGPFQPHLTSQPQPPSQPQTEVLLYNPERMLTEGILTTVYVRRKGRWVTPMLECGGQDGTTRRWALEQGLCVEGEIAVSSLQSGEVVCLSNGVRGFLPGRIVLDGL